MSRIAWAKPPTLGVTVNVPAPPQTDNMALNDWMQKVHAAISAISQDKMEMQEFLNDVLNIIKSMDRDGLQSIVAVTGAADAVYSVNETDLINALVVAVNALRTNLQE